MNADVDNVTSHAGQEPSKPDGSPQPMTPAEIAWVCHEANRAYCASIGDYSQRPWEEAPQWQRSSAINGVLLHINHPEASAEDSHASWLKEKEDDGWTYGPVKDEGKKTHPCFMPYNQLPTSHKRKDHLFRAIVKGLTAI
jgi:hypothetical protein